MPDFGVDGPAALVERTFGTSRDRSRTAPPDLATKGTTVTISHDDLILISVDDHLVEPPDMFVHHIPAKYADRAPKVIRTERGDDVWTFEGAIIPNVGHPEEFAELAEHLITNRYLNAQVVRLDGAIRFDPK